MEPRSRWEKTLVIGGFGVALCALVLWFAAAIRQAREDVRELNCTNEMSGIALDAVNHYMVHRAYPDLNTDSADDGLPGWRSVNLERDARGWICPRNAASYRVVSGPGTIFDGGKVTPADVSDGVANTMLFFEFSDSERHRIHSPQIRLADLDLLAGPDGMLPAMSAHERGRGFVFADALVCRQVKPISIAVLKALATRDGGEPVTRQQLVDDGYLAIRIEREPKIPGDMDETPKK